MTLSLFGKRREMIGPRHITSEQNTQITKSEDSINGQVV